MTVYSYNCQLYTINCFGGKYESAKILQVPRIDISTKIVYNILKKHREQSAERRFYPLISIF